MDSLSSQG